MASYQSRFPLLLNLFTCLPLFFRNCIFQCTLSLFIQMQSHNMTSPCTRRGANVGNSYQGSERNAFHAYRQGCTKRTMRSRHGRPRRASVSAIISLFENAGILFFPSISEADIESVVLSQTTPLHLSIPSRILSSVFSLDLPILKAEIERVEQENKTLQYFELV